MTSKRVIGAGLAALVVVIAIAVGVVGPGISDDLEADVVSALRDAGLDGVEVDVDGRTIQIAAVDDETAGRAREIADRIDGVRRVELDVSTAAITTTTTPAPTSTSGSPGATTTVVASTTTTSTTTMSTTTMSTTTTSTTTTSTTTTMPEGSEEVRATQALIDDALGADGVVFEADDADEPTQPSKDRLDDVAAALADTDLRYTVVGHLPAGRADADVLSLARAWAVAGYLEFRKIPFDRVDVRGAGASEPLPLLDEDDPANERIEIIVLQGER